MSGRVWEEFTVGEVIPHRATKTVTQEENRRFCDLTDNTQPLHLDEGYAKTTPFGRIVVNGLLPIAWAVGVSVRDTTDGTLVANLGYEDVRSPAPVFPGDTLQCETTVVDKRRTSRPERGLVDLRHRVTKQDGTEVCNFRRLVLVRVRDPEATA